MLRGLTSAGLGKLEHTRQFIELASKYQFQTVDINALPFINEYGEDGAKHILESNQVTIGSIGLPVEWRSTEDVFLQDLEHLAHEAAAAKKLGCTRCCTYILPSTDYESASFMNTATRRLRLCAQILGAYGISLGLEFVGPHHLRTRWANPFIWTLADTLDWIKAINEPNVGLLFDAYHWYTTGSTVEDILQLQPHQIVHVHINDAKDIPVKDVLDNDRLYPGEGVIDLVSFLQALRQIGYKGSITQEVLASPPEADAETMIAKSKMLYDKLFVQAFASVTTI